MSKENAAKEKEQKEAAHALEQIESVSISESTLPLTHGMKNESTLTLVTVVAMEMQQEQ